VSPTVKNGNQAGAGVEAVNAYGVASSDGNRVLYWNSGPIGETSSGIDHFSVSTRSPSGWTARGALPQPAPEPRDPISSGDPMWLMPSADLSSMVFTALDPFTPVELNFSSPEFHFASTYLSSEGGPAVWLGKPTVPNPVPALEGVEEPDNLVPVGASADMSVIYYEYYGTLLPEDAPRRPTVESGNIEDLGLYEWRAGKLKAAGLLPPKEAGAPEEEDEYGAMAAAVGLQPLLALPLDFNNQVSSSGNTMLFVSPSPEAGSGLPPQLYARVNGDRTVLISRSELTGLPSVSGVDAATGLSRTSSYAYGSPDGSKAFFTSEEQLTSDAPQPEPGLLDEYQFDLATNTLSYLPGVSAPILAASEDGNTLVFDNEHEGLPHLEVYAGGQVTEVMSLPAPSKGQLEVLQVRLSANDQTLVFQTNAAIPGFNNGEQFSEVYRYDLATDGLSCISCPPQGQTPTGSASMSHDDMEHAVLLTADSRGISEDGSEIFFDTPDRLVPGDTNTTRDVYEWHAGRLSLISSGAGPGESLFLDNSSSGSDVFFATTSPLSGSDTDGAFDVYDARAGGGFPEPPPSGCTGDCRSEGTRPQPGTSLASTSLLGAGEQLPSLPSPPHRTASKVLSRTQELARRLKACRRKRGHLRHVCEVQARRRYGHHPVRRRS
jgi:hypothetical protein